MLQSSTLIGGAIGAGVGIVFALLRRDEDGSRSGGAMLVVLLALCGVVIGMQVGKRSGEEALESLPALTTRAELDGQLTGDKPVLVMVYTTWCHYCHQLAPDIVSLAEDYAGRVAVFGVNHEAVEPGLQNALPISQGYPTVFIYHHGEPYAILPGARNASEYCEILDELLARNDATAGITAGD
jgi:thioredoxin-like negative regulator of GroEL